MRDTDKYAVRSRMLVLLLALIAGWLLWSWLFKPLLLGLGLFSCLLVLYLARRMGYFDGELFALRVSGRLFAYWGWLGKEIVKSSLEVSRIVLDPKLPISPRTVEIDAQTADRVDQTILANSITLTPGTLSLDVHSGTIKTHSLTESGARALASGEMARRAAAVRRA